MIRNLILLLLLAEFGVAQLTSYTEDFNDNLLIGWDTNAGQTTYTLTEADQRLNILYNRNNESWEWDNINFTPPQSLDVSLTPVITLDVKSSVATELVLKPTYTNDTSDWLPINIPPDNAWHTYTFDLTQYTGQLMTRIYFYLDGGSQEYNSGIVEFDNLLIGGYALLIQNPVATAIDSSSIQLEWLCSDPEAVNFYSIFKASDQGFTPDEASYLDTSHGLSYLDTDLLNNTTYYYRISATDTTGTESNYSSEVSARTFTPGLHPSIQVLSEDANTVGLYEKYEIILDLGNAQFNNPFDPAQIDIGGLFVSPSGEEWPINAFWNNSYDISEWTLRFAANESGIWTYVLHATDMDGTGYSEEYNFQVIESDRSGWIQVAESNPHYLQLDDGSPFWGVGVYYPWNVTENGMNQLGAHDANLFGYWNGTYDGAGNGGGNRLFESMQSGIGQYDQLKCARIEDILEMASNNGMRMMYAIWPHDAFSETVWATMWESNPYQFVCSADDIYSDATAWEFQKKQYRYLIARFGWDQHMGIWEIMNEITGTDGWQHGYQVQATAWVDSMHQYLSRNDPFRRPTTVSKHGGNYWPEGYGLVDMPNVHLYETGWTPEYANNPMRSSMYIYHDLSRSFWADFDKPATFGEAGYTDSYGNYSTGSIEYTQAFHNAYFASWSNGLSTAPLWWDMTLINSGEFDVIQAVNSIASRINYPQLDLTPENISVDGADGFVMVSDTLAFGWIRDHWGEPVSGREINFSGLTDSAYSIQWYNTWTGALISEHLRPAFGNTISDVIPQITSGEGDIAFITIPTPSGTVPYELRLHTSASSLLNTPSQVAQLTCYVVDEFGRICLNAENGISFLMNGPGSLLGDVEQNANHGVASLEFRADTSLGLAQIIAESVGLVSDTIAIDITNTILVDNFENYTSSATLAQHWQARVGTEASVELEFNEVGAGAQALSFTYSIGNGSPPYSGIEYQFPGTYAGTNFLNFWLDSNGSNRLFVILINERDGTYWQYDHSLDQSGENWLSIPLAAFSSNDGSIEPDLQNLESISFNTLPGAGGWGSGELYIDDLSFSATMQTVDIANFQALPDKFHFDSIYPNPFNQSTNLRFVIERAGDVHIQIFDLKGREIFQSQKSYSTAGVNQYLWDTKNLSSGVYLVKVSSSGQSQSQKCILLR